MHLRNIVLACAAALIAVPAEAQPNRIYGTGTGRLSAMAGEGAREPDVTRDCRLVVYVRQENRPSEARPEVNLGPTSMWVAELPSGVPRLLLSENDGGQPERTLIGFGTPIFLSDGRRVVFSSAGWATSGAVHMIDVTTGEERFVIDGELQGVVTSGGWRDALIVERHQYRAHNAGSFQSLELVDLSGETLAVISRRDPPEPDLRPWLQRRGMTARLGTNGPERCAEG